MEKEIGKGSGVVFEIYLMYRENGRVEGSPLYEKQSLQDLYRICVSDMVAYVALLHLLFHGFAVYAADLVWLIGVLFLGLSC